MVIFYRVLKNSGSQRGPYLGNYERAYGFPAGTRTTSFGWWSSLRSALFRVAPWHIVAWYAGFIGIGISLAIRLTTVPARISLCAVLLAGMGLVDGAVSSLADAAETERHLFLFHVITDFTILFALVWAGRMFQGKASFRANS
jgi:hypothetical protein